MKKLILIASLLFIAQFSFCQTKQEKESGRLALMNKVQAEMQVINTDKPERIEADKQKRKQQKQKLKAERAALADKLKKKKKSKNRP